MVFVRYVATLFVRYVATCPIPTIVDADNRVVGLLAFSHLPMVQ